MTKSRAISLLTRHQRKLGDKKGSKEKGRAKWEIRKLVEDVTPEQFLWLRVIQQAISDLYTAHQDAAYFFDGRLEAHAHAIGLEPESVLRTMVDEGLVPKGLAGQ